MGHHPATGLPRLFPLTAALLAALPSAGCGDGITRYPVSGHITLNGQPFIHETTAVLFKPDKSKGNNSALEPVGKADDDGIYSVTTNGRSGAPPGWYKVVVTAHDGKWFASTEKGHDRRPAVGSLLPQKYGLASTTDLAVEVVADPVPGAYDLKLSK